MMLHAILVGCLLAPLLAGLVIGAVALTALGVGAVIASLLRIAE